METKSQTLTYPKESAMSQVSARQQIRHSTRFMTVLVISTAVLLTGTVYGYAAVKAQAVKSVVVGAAPSSIYGPSHLKAPLTDASVKAMAETVTPQAPTSMGPVTVASNSMSPLK